MFVFRVHTIIPATTFDNRKLPVVNIWNIRRFQYILETIEVPPQIVRNWVPDQPARAAIPHLGLPAVAAIPNHYTTPRVFWGSDLIHVNDPANIDEVPSHVPIDTNRILYINDL